ncbi:MAG: ABC transporter ATP-binding protein, partial [Caulobacter sp.]|nr:ABC transporter ATP-binding protein [Caulobacter sp.]
KAEHQVISTRLLGGRTVIHVLADQDPGAGFTPVEGGLEDVYFSTLSNTRRAA